jgi:malate dehydrogenase (oxaloacetate-decarboxylating)(NADP+)
MVAMGHADGIVTGVTRHFDAAMNEIRQAIDPKSGRMLVGMSIVIARGRTLFIADTNITEFPDSHEMADIAVEAARGVRALGFTPRVAFLSYSTFGQPDGERAQKVREAVRLLDQRDGVDFEYDGEMSAEIALDPESRKLYPFCRLTDAANVLIMPAIQSAAIVTKMMATVGGATVMGPVVLGLDKPVQFTSLSAPVSEIVNHAMLAAYGVTR